MIPVLYYENETQFQTNGIGRLSDAISCVVTEERNGIYELSMQYPMTGKYFSELQEDRIIFAKPSESATNQPFRIYKISRPLNGIVTVDAEHISYLLNKIVCMPFTAGSCAEAFTKIPLNAVPSCPFTFWTDKSVASTFRLSEPRAIRGMLGGEQGSILDTYGKGDYEFDKFAVYLRVNRGADNGVVLRYGKNITELNRTTDMSTVYTGIVPFWKNETQTVTLPEQFLMSSHASDFAYQIVKPVDFSGTWQEAPTVAQLRARAQKYLTDNEGWLLNDHIKVSFVALFDTEEYKDYASLQRVSLCDTVTIIYTALGVNAKAKVIRTVYDTLLERYNEIELGSAPNSLGKAIQEQILEEVPTTSEMQTAISNGTKLITGNQGGYVVLKTNANGKPEEILIMDTEDISTATKVWRFNNSGLGYSNTGYNGTYKQAWTIDGAFYTDWVTTGLMTANIIKAGILSDAAGKNSWNMVTGAFELNAAAKVGDTGYTLTQIKANAEGLQTKVEANGVISAINQSPESITINANKINFVLGNANNKSGKMLVQDADGNEIGSWNKDGITATAGTLGGWTIGERVIMKAASDYRVRLLSPATPSGTSLAIAAGGKNENDSWVNSFYVRYDGYVYATNANITGTITASGGKIGGFTINNNYLVYGSLDGTANNQFAIAGGTTFQRVINGETVSYLKMAIGGNFAVDRSGKLYCAGADITGIFKAVQKSTNSGKWYKTQIQSNRIIFYLGGTGTTPSWSTEVGAIDFVDEQIIDIPTGTYRGNFTFDYSTIEALGGKFGNVVTRWINGEPYETSDKRIKKDIKYLQDEECFKNVIALSPVQFRYRADYAKSTKIHHGFIAQDVEECGFDWDFAYEGQDGYKNVGYKDLIADLVGSIKYLSARVDELEEKLNGHTDRSN